MDEYTFIVLAKLKADRRKLEREQRAALRLEELRAEAPAVEGRRWSETRASSREAEMREPS